MESTDYGTFKELLENAGDINEICEFLGEINKSWSNDRRRRILNYLYHEERPVTFREIKSNVRDKNQKEISTGSLHSHLEKLAEGNFIRREGKKPVEYSLTNFTKQLIYLISFYEAQKNIKAEAKSDIESDIDPVKLQIALS